jgi:hypothetical protein
MSRRLWPLALLALLVAPTVAASWAAKGSREPDTPQDAADGWMFGDADTAPCAASGSCDSNRVYLDGFTSYCAPPYGVCAPTTLSPNVAALGTQVMAYPTVTTALLGVWKDCNADGYVGLGDQGLWEYRSEVLAAWPGAGASVCPVAPTPIDWTTGLPRAGWFPSHNDGKWVRELLPLGPPDPRTVSGADANPWDLEDPTARVWADGGLPGDAPTPDCYLAPVPSGTFRTTGALLGYADCFDGDHAAPLVASAPVAGPLADQRNPWGSSQDASVATLLACSGNRTQAQPRPTGPDASGSPGGTVGELEAEAECDPWGDRSLGDAPYALEGDAVDVHGVRVRPDHSLQYQGGARPAAPLGALRGPATPGDLGVRAQDEGFWVEDAVTGLSRDPFVSREQTATLASVTRVTTYAYVSPAIGSLPLDLPRGRGVAGVYGAEACGSFSTGVHGGWQCNPLAWWPDGEPVYAARVGDAYDLRDVDCYDESADAAREAGVSWGALTGSSCA